MRSMKGPRSKLRANTRKSCAKAAIPGTRRKGLVAELTKGNLISAKVGSI